MSADEPIDPSRPNDAQPPPSPNVLDYATHCGEKLVRIGTYTDVMEANLARARLEDAGIRCFKIEGRKKSPLYVATTTDYYRRLLDGKLDDAERSGVEADLQTVFSRGGATGRAAGRSRS